MEALTKFSFGALGVLTLICSLVLQKALFNVLSLGQRTQGQRSPSQQRPDNYIPDFTLPLLASAGYVSSSDLKGRSVTLMFVGFGESSITQPRQLLVSMRALRGKHAGRFCLVCSGQDEGTNRFLLESAVHLNEVIVLVDREGVLANTLGIQRSPAAYIYDQEGRLLQAGDVETPE
jgi:hypothetical protein